MADAIRRPPCGFASIPGVMTSHRNPHLCNLSVHLPGVPGAGVPQSRRAPLPHTRALYRDFRGSLNTPMVKPMFLISFRINYGHFSASFTLNLSPGLIPNHMIELAVRKAIQKHEQSSPSARIACLKFGPVGSVRFGFRSTEIFRFFDLLHLCSVSPFGFGCSVDGSVGNRLGVLQAADS